MLHSKERGTEQREVMQVKQGKHDSSFNVLSMASWGEMLAFFACCPKILVCLKT